VLKLGAKKFSNLGHGKREKKERGLREKSRERGRGNPATRAAWEGKHLQPVKTLTQGLLLGQSERKRTKTKKEEKKERWAGRERIGEKNGGKKGEGVSGLDAKPRFVRPTQQYRGRQKESEGLGEGREGTRGGKKPDCERAPYLYDSGTKETTLVTVTRGQKLGNLGGFTAPSKQKKTWGSKGKGKVHYRLRVNKHDETHMRNSVQPGIHQTLVETSGKRKDVQLAETFSHDLGMGRLTLRNETTTISDEYREGNQNH